LVGFIEGWALHTYRAISRWGTRHGVFVGFCFVSVFGIMGNEWLAFLAFPADVIMAWHGMAWLSGMGGRGGQAMRMMT
jgi:hypothetical protein